MGEDTDSGVSSNLVAGRVTQLVLESEPASQLVQTILTTLPVLTVANCYPAFLSRYKDETEKFKLCDKV